LVLFPEEGSRPPKHAADNTVSLHTFCSFYDRKQTAALEWEGHDPRWGFLVCGESFNVETLLTNQTDIFKGKHENRRKTNFSDPNIHVGLLTI